MLYRGLTRAWPGPIVIGGSGGSGTRAVAAVMRELGVFLGGTLNPELDSIPIGLCDIKWGPRYTATKRVSMGMRLDFLTALHRHLRPSPRVGTRWGWKHPQSYLQLPLLADRFPRLRFLHLIRDARDMGLSENHNQLRLYGSAAFGYEAQATPQELVRFWDWANLRVAAAGEQLGSRYMLVRLEDLCDDPDREVMRMRSFIGGDRSTPIEGAVSCVDRPSSLGRWHELSADLVRELEDLAAVGLRRFGYLAA